LDPRPEPQDLLLQLQGVHVEGISGDDLDAGGGQPAARGRAWYAILESAVHVLCLVDQFPKSVVITVLRADCGNHDLIMVPAASGSSVRDRIAGAGRLS